MGHVCGPSKKQVVSRERLQRLALKTYGADRQLLQLAEELSEASAAVVRFMNKKSDARPVIEEIVDVESVVASLRDHLADDVLWENMRKVKAEKLAFILGVEVE